MKRKNKSQKRTKEYKSVMICGDEEKKPSGLYHTRFLDLFRRIKISSFQRCLYIHIYIYIYIYKELIVLLTSFKELLLLLL